MVFPKLEVLVLFSSLPYRMLNGIELDCFCLITRDFCYVKEIILFSLGYRYWVIVGGLDLR